MTGSLPPRSVLHSTILASAIAVPRFWNQRLSGSVLARSAPLQTALEQVPDSILQNAWLDLILHHPADYLHARAKAFRWVTLAPDISLCVPYVVGLRGPPQTMEALGFHTRFSQRDQRADAYGKLFVGTPVFSHLTFIVVMMAELAFLIWRRRTPDIAMIALLCSAIVFACSFFFISLACDYRYDYVLDLAALTVFVYVALDPACSEDKGATRT